MFCNNCGVKGHVFRTCNEPITSCGIILIHEPTIPVNPTKVNVLMIRRKDSMSFAEFLQGKYRIENEDYIRTLLSNMTIPELNRIKTLTFDELWTGLWGSGHDYHSKEYHDSKTKFEQIQLKPIVQTMVSVYTEPEWGFPKGRRSHRETNLTCAIREFTEETNIPRDSYVVCKNLMFQEVFKGTNGVEYKHTYFLAFLRHPEQVDITQAMTSLQRREVSCVSWMTLAECRKVVRPHYTQRLELLDSFERCLNTFDLQDNIAVQQG